MACATRDLTTLPGVGIGIRLLAMTRNALTGMIMAKLSGGFERHPQSVAEWVFLGVVALGGLTVIGMLAFYLFT